MILPWKRKWRLPKYFLHHIWTKYISRYILKMLFCPGDKSSPAAGYIFCDILPHNICFFFCHTWNFQFIFDIPSFWYMYFPHVWWDIFEIIWRRKLRLLVRYILQCSATQWNFQYIFDIFIFKESCACSLDIFCNVLPHKISF